MFLCVLVLSVMVLFLSVFSQGVRGAGRPSTDAVFRCDLRIRVVWIDNIWGEVDGFFGGSCCPCTGGKSLGSCCSFRRRAWDLGFRIQGCRFGVPCAPFILLHLEFSSLSVFCNLTS